MTETPSAAPDGDTPDVATLPDTALSQELAGFVKRLDGQDCTMAGLFEMVGDRGFGLLLLILALPAALPIPATGYGTPFGLLMAGLGMQIAIGRTEPWLPGFVARRKMPYRLLSFSVRNARLPLRVVEFLIKPRLSRLSRNRAFLSGIGVMIVVMSLFMSMPIPLTNTAPSFVIFVLAAGMLEEDGLVLLGGLILAPIAAAIAGSAAYVAVTMGPEAVETVVKPVIKGIFGM